IGAALRDLKPPTRRSTVAHAGCTVGRHDPPRPAAVGGGLMHIAFFGSSLVSAYWNRSATYYRGLLKALAARGHVITFYEPDAYERQKHRDIEDPPWAEVVVYRPEPDTALAAVESARAADLVVIASGVGVLDALLEAAVLDLKGP